MKEIDVEKLCEIAGAKAPKLEDEIRLFSNQLLQNMDLKFFFADSSISTKNKMKLFDDLNPGASSLFRKLFGLLTEEGLTNKIPWLSDKFSETITRETGIQFLEVKSARSLSDSQAKQLEQAVGKKVRLRFMQDPDLIGGISLKWEDGHFMDFSLAGKLEDMKEALLV